MDANPGKLRDYIVLEKLVTDMEAGTLGDVLEHPVYQSVVDKLKKSPLGNLRASKAQGMDVLAAFVLPYTEEEDIQLAQRVRSWATYLARQLVLNETDPFANTPEQKLVEKTQSDPRFWPAYKFKSWGQRWKHPIRGDPSSPVKLVSIDLEEVKCEKDGRHFVCIARLCAVGSDYETLIDTLVKPAGTVIVYCTHIHGITEKELQGATLTQACAQAQVMDLITPGTVLLGHSLYLDLRVLGIDYKRVIDTALLFVEEGREEGKEFPSLADLCHKVLGYTFREKGDHHDCLQDAMVPMKLVHYLLRMRGSDD